MDTIQNEEEFEEKLVEVILLESDSSVSSSSSSSSLTSSAVSEDTDSSIELHANVKRRKIVRISNFVELVARYDQYQFQEYFRMLQSTTDFLIGKITTAEVLPSHTFGREKITPRKALLMTLWYLANTETFRQLSDRFDVSYSSAYRVIEKIVNFLQSIRAEYIKWPTGESANGIVRQFHGKAGISGIIGAIDGSHIRIKKPVQDSEVYFNRKHFYSIIIQGVCDNTKRFINVMCGEPGSIHDTRCLRKSNLYDLFENNRLGHHFLIGDSAYPVLHWLIPPYKDNGNLTNNHKRFNTRHATSRIVIEHAFGLLKGRFRRLLHGFENTNLNFIVSCVTAACVLHNICINLSDTYNIEIVEGNDVADNIGDEGLNEVNGINRRDELLQEMFF